MLDYELLLCAFHQKNSLAINQVLLRLEASHSDACINLIRCLVASGIPNVLSNLISKGNLGFHCLGQNNSYLSFFTPHIIASNRMIAQLYRDSNMPLSKFNSDQHFLSLSSHCDINGISFQELDYDKLKAFVLFPNFLFNLEIFLQNLISGKSGPVQTKLRYLSYLLCVKIFFAKNVQQIEDAMKSCFDMALFVKFCNPSSENDQIDSEFSPLELPIFQDRENDLLKAILVLLQN